MALEQELATFKREMERLVAESQGKFALVHGESVVAVFDTYADALKAGYQKFGLEAFMVKQIAAQERTHFFTRDLTPCLR